MEQSKTKKQMAWEYDVAPNTFSRWLKRAELDIPRGLILPDVQKIIYEKIGNPGRKVEEMKEVKIK